MNTTETGSFFVEDLIKGLDAEIQKINETKRFREYCNQFTEKDFSKKYDEDLRLFAEVIGATNEIKVIIHEDVLGFPVMLITGNRLVIQITRNEFSEKMVRLFFVDEEIDDELYEIW